MVTLAELRSESYWDLEFQPPSIARVCQRLRTFYGVGPIAIGSKGDERHLRGYHRSARWIRFSRFCTNRTYSVSETPGNRTPGNIDWLCAIDMTVPRAQLLPACARLDAAVRAGKLEKITEWYGNIDGDTRVDGYDNIRNTFASSDTSHLWHLHLSFDRGRAGEEHDDLYSILTGEGKRTMFCVFGNQGPEVEAMQRLILAAGGALPRFGADGDYGDETVAALKLLLGGDGRTYGPAQYVLLHAKAFGGAGVPGPVGPMGPIGPPGPAGKDGLSAGSNVTISGTITVTD